VIAPMLFLLKPGVAARLEAFVKGGGTLLLTYLSGIVDQSNLVLDGGWPGGGLRRLAGVWAEEIDAIYPDSPQRMVPAGGNPLGLPAASKVREYCDRVHAEGATVLATYQTDFYAGAPCLTVKSTGRGRVYYLAARPAEDAFHDALARALVKEIGLSRNLEVDLPEGVTVQRRAGGGRRFLFVHNLRHEPQTLALGSIRLTDVADGTVLTGTVTLPPFASRVVERT
jgi:beta-galactosidase